MGKQAKSMQDGLASVQECITRDDMQLFMSLSTPEGEGEDEQVLLRACKTQEVICLVALRNERIACARLALFVREGRGDVYAGLFQSDGEPSAVFSLFAVAKDIVCSRGHNSIVGPIDGSIWDRYRFKTSCFDEPPYTGEPTNPPSYPELWRRVGFSPIAHWHSDALDGVIPAIVQAKMLRRLRRAERLGYTFRPIDSESATSFDQDLLELHGVIMERYASFPCFEEISAQEFLERFGYLRALIDPAGTVLAFAPSTDELVGFAIALPDYAYAVHTGKTDMEEMRQCPQRYVVLYIGVQRGHEGLGNALCARLLRRQEQTGAGCVSALVQDGRLSGSYIGRSARRIGTYELYKLNIPDSHLR